MKEADVAIGPVQLIVLGFNQPDFHGEIIDELERLRESDTVRVIDAMVVYKDAAGDLEVEHLSNLSTEEAVELGSKIGALIGLGIEGEEGAEAGAAAGAEAAADGVRVFSTDQGWDVLEDIPNDSAAALLLLEHHWACHCVMRSSARAASASVMGSSAHLTLSRSDCSAGRRRRTSTRSRPPRRPRHRQGGRDNDHNVRGRAQPREEVLKCLVPEESPGAPPGAPPGEPHGVSAAADGPAAPQVRHFAARQAGPEPPAAATNQRLRIEALGGVPDPAAPVCRPPVAPAAHVASQGRAGRRLG
jgi:uncharacterized membrane protein